MAKPPQKLILRSMLSPGDVMTLTVTLESLHATYPKEFLTDVRTPIPEIWENNPHITPLDEKDPAVKIIAMEYPQVHKCNQIPINFISCYTEFLGQQLKKPLSATRPTPIIYLTDEEKQWQTMVQQHHHFGKRVRYALVNAGVKDDYPAKQWPVEFYQQVVNDTSGIFQWVQVGEKHHNHPELKGVINLIGQTTHRMFHRLVYHAALGLGPVTYLLHLCAAFEVPYIYLAGGREPVTWINYPKMHTLHTIGMLPCCATWSCWKSRIVPLNDKDQSVCEQPILGMQRPVGRCMAMISPQEVISLVRKYAS